MQAVYRSLSEKIAIDIDDDNVTFIFRDSLTYKNQSVYQISIFKLPWHDILSVLTQDEKDNLLKYLIEYRDKYNPPGWVITEVVSGW